MAQAAWVRRAVQAGVDLTLGFLVFCLVAGFLIGDGGARAAPGMIPDAAALMAAGDRAEMARAAVVGLPAPAAAVQPLMLAAPQDGDATVYRQTSHQAAMTVLALVFSLLFSLNLAFWRHLRSAYVVRR
jgi:hypothetical protein